MKNINQLKQRISGWIHHNISIVQRISLKDMVFVILLGEGAIVCVDILCYRSIVWIIPLQLLLIPYGIVIKKYRREKRKRVYIQGFREMLQSVMTSLQAGYSLENACKTGFLEVQSFYQGKNNAFIDQLQEVVYGIELNIPVEKLFYNFAAVTEIEDIYQFASMMDIARNTGGNMVEILKNAMINIQKKIETKEEIGVMMSGKLFEKNIMLFMPFGILSYLRLTNPAYVSCFYETTAGHILMSVILMVVLICFFWTEKIMNIEF